MNDTEMDPRRTPDQGTITGRRLGNIEYCWAKTDEISPLVFVGVLKLENGPSPEILRQALDKYQESQPVLAASLVMRGTDYHFAFSDAPPPICLEVLEGQCADHWHQVAEEVLNQRIDTQTAPLMRFILLHRQQCSELILVSHHSIIDGRSGGRMLHELLELCAALEAGTHVDTPKRPAVLMPAMDDMFPKQHLGIQGLVRRLGFLARQMKAEMVYRWRLGKEQNSHIGQSARCRILPCELNREQTTALVRAARSRRLPVNAVLHASMLKAVSEHFYAGTDAPLRGLAFADMRPFLKPPLSDDRLGAYISMLQYTTAIPSDGDVWKLSEAVRDAILSATKGGDKFVAAQLSRKLIDFMAGQSKMRLGMIALSYAGPLQLRQQYGSIAVLGLHGFVSNNTVGPELAGFGKIIDGRLILDLQYMDTDMDDALAAQMADDIVYTLCNAANEKEG